MPINTSLLDQIYRNDSTLKTLIVSYQNLNDADLVILIDALKTNTHIESIDISGNLISDNGIKILASPDCKFISLIACDCKIKNVRDLLQINRLVSLSLASNEIAAESIAAISENKVLSYVSLAGNNLKDEEAVVLSRTTSITSLILSHNRITAAGSIALANNTSIIHLNLNHNRLESEGVIALKENITIRELFVGGNHISITGIKTLAANRTYTTLDVSYNKIGNDAAMELLQHPTVVNLNLSYNEISFEGVQSLPEGTLLQHFNISYNFLKDTGIIAIAKNKSILHLDASGNRVGFEGTFALAKSKTLISLVYSSNAAGDAGAVILAQNASLKELIMSYNGIKDAGELSLAANTTLQKLNLNYNMIGDKGKEALINNKTLKTLTLSPEQPPEFTDENLDRIFLLSESFLCICDLSGTLQYFNPAFSRALGRTQDELLGNSFFKYLHPADKKSLEQQLTLDENFIFYNHENRYQCQDGSYRIISWTSNIIHSRMYTVGTDITDQRRVEKDLLYVEQLALLNRVVEAENYSKRQREFISHLSHEIRNPLSGILGLIDSLQDQFKEVESVMKSLRIVSTLIMQKQLKHSFSEITGYLNEMSTCARYQEAILNDNLDLVRITENKLTLNNHPFELEQLLLEIISMFHEKAKKKGLVIMHVFPELKETLVKGDYLRFKQIVVNLLGNAVKFTDKGSITVKCVLSNQTEDHIQVDVSIIDTGVGLNSAEQGELFRRFSQPVTGESYGGSGIGLYLSRELAHAMGGDISVNSEKTKGSNFRVSILFETISSKEVEVSKEISNLQKPKELEIAASNILVVEDNTTNQKLLCRILDRAKCTWKIAGNGREAVNAFVAAWRKQRFYDVILMDILMPVMSGLEATIEIRRIEKENNLPRTPIIAITANALPSDRKEGADAGIDHYLTKPLNAKETLKNISRLSKQGGAEVKLTTPQLLTRVDTAAPDFHLPAVTISLNLPTRANSTPLSSTVDAENVLLDSPVLHPETSQHTPKLFKPHLISHRENEPLEEPVIFSDDVPFIFKIKLS